MNKAAKLMDKLKEPDREFSPMPFWFLNDELRDEEIRRQLADFRDKGVWGVVLHPRIGIPTSIPYLSDAFMHAIVTAVECAAGLGMKVILYDEGMYPSGSAHGLVAARNPDFASQCIIKTDTPDKGRVITKTADGQWIVQVPSRGTIRGIHFGEDDKEPGAPLAADLLNPDAVAAFLEITHERYYSLLFEHFGKTVIGFFTDEPSLLGRGGRKGAFAFTRGLEGEIVRRGGTLPALDGLFTGDENETVKLYRTLIFERENEVYYRALSEWCERHGIALMGHPHRGDDIECEKWFHVPGQDLVLRWIAPEKGGLSGGVESAQAKCSADAARILGRRRNSNECWGACNKDGIPWAFSGADLKWYTDWLGVRGVNLFIPHAFYYSVSGKRKDERPPDVGPNSIWWEHFGTISRYISRISCLMCDSISDAKVCVPCGNRAMPIAEVRELYENQIEFHYIPRAAIPAETIQDGKLRIGENTYDTVHGGTDDRLASLKKLGDPAASPHRSIRTDRFCPGLRCAPVIKDGVYAYFLTNEGEDAIECEAVIPQKGALLSMDFWSGTVRELSCEEAEGGTAFHLHLKRRESRLIVVDSESEPRRFEDPKPVTVDIRLREAVRDDSAFSITYEGEYIWDGTTDASICLQGEEMAECFVNGKFAGFSLWNEHEFRLTPHLHPGANRITVRFTGSAVNRFTEHRTEYGLKQ